MSATAPLPSTPKYPGVEVQLTGSDGNVFAIIGAVSKALRRAGHGEAVEAFTADVFAATCYDDALQRVMTWVEVS